MSEIKSLYDVYFEEYFKQFEIDPKSRTKEEAKKFGNDALKFLISQNNIGNIKFINDGYGKLNFIFCGNVVSEENLVFTLALAVEKFYNLGMPNGNDIMFSETGYLHKVETQKYKVGTKSIRDTHNLAHVYRVAMIAYELAKKINLKHNAVILAVIFALFHDSARAFEWTDHWDKESAFLSVSFLRYVGFPCEDHKLLEIAKSVADKKNIKTGEDLASVIAIIVDIGDTIDILRVKRTNFDLSLLFAKYKKIESYLTEYQKFAFYLTAKWHDILKLTVLRKKAIDVNNNFFETYRATRKIRDDYVNSLTLDYNHEKTLCEINDEIQHAILRLSKFVSGKIDNEDSEDELEVSDSKKVSLRKLINSKKACRDFSRISEHEPLGKLKTYKLSDSIDGKYVVLFRGLKYNSDFFSLSARKLMCYFEDISDKPIFSSFVFDSAKIYKQSIGDFISTRLECRNFGIVTEALAHTKKFISFLYKRMDMSPALDDFIFSNMLIMLVQANVNLRRRVENLTVELAKYLKTNYEALNINTEELLILTEAFKDYSNSIGKNLVISTTFRANIAVKYALPFIIPAEFLNPEYNKDGKPKNRTCGEVDIIVVPLAKYIYEFSKINEPENKTSESPEFIDISASHIVGHFPMKTELFRDNEEVAFLGYIPGNYVIESFPIYLPDLSKKYEVKYFEDMFGLTLENYISIKAKLLNDTTYNNGIIELMDILLKHYSFEIENKMLPVILQGKKRIIPMLSEECKLLEKNAIEYCGSIDVKLENRFINSTIPKKSTYRERKVEKSKIIISTREDKHRIMINGRFTD